jgi:aldehyde dehydrogenase (NAD+)
VAAARNAGGARLVIGGDRLSGLDEGWFFEPTIFDVTDQSCAIGPRGGLRAGADDRPFPRRARGRATREQRQLRPRGRRLDEGHRPRLPLASQIRTGQIHINSWGIGSGVELSFGGIRQSGFGREKGLRALDEYRDLQGL